MIWIYFKVCYLINGFFLKKLFRVVGFQLFVSLEFGSLTTAQLMEKVRGLQNLAYQLGLEEGTVYIDTIDYKVNSLSYTCSV